MASAFWQMESEIRHLKTLQGAAVAQSLWLPAFVAAGVAFVVLAATKAGSHKDWATAAPCRVFR